MTIEHTTAPEATPAPAAPPSMYDRIGGAPTIREAVDRFYRRLLDDAELAPYFPADLTALKQHQAALLTQVLGGPSRYAGRDLKTAHQPLNISAPHFRRVVFYLVGTVWELGAPMDVVLAVGETVSSLQDQIVRPDAEDLHEAA